MAFFNITDLNRLKEKLELIKLTLQSYISKPNISPYDYGYYFHDGVRKIDFILVYTSPEKASADEEARDMVNMYLSNLKAIGINVELERSTLNHKTTFIKIHCPLSVLYHYAFQFNICLDMDNNNILYLKHKYGLKFIETILTKPDTNHPVYKRAVKTISKCKPDEPTTAERILIVEKILMATHIQHDTTGLELGYRSLMSKKHLSDAFPMHDGQYEWTFEGSLNDRQLLARYWGSPWKFYKKQPLDLIKKYFGPAVAFYFAWMEYYCKIMSFTVVVGIMAFVYAISSIDISHNSKAELFCKSNETVCARCSDFKTCKFHKLQQSCNLVRYNYLVENYGMICYAIIMSFWSTIFLELWKRREKVLAYRWNVLNVDAEAMVRPQYLESTKHHRICQFSGELETYTPIRIKLFRNSVSIFVVTIMAIAVLAVLMATVSYRLWLRHHLAFSDTGDDKYKNSIPMLSASLISFVMIVIFETIFEIVAEYLTIYENPKTDIEFTNSFTLKIFVFGFVNGFAPLIYLSFVKGRTYVHPGMDLDNLLSYFQSDICEVHGCLIDICTQLVIILIGTSLLRSIRQIVVPLFINFVKKRSIPHDKYVPVYEYTYRCSQLRGDYLVAEYKHIVLQYGYLTMFAASFPLAPLLALVYNIIEIRVDAYKMTRLYQRPVPAIVNGIGAWNTILRILTFVSIVTNPAILTFTTDFVRLTTTDCNFPDDPINRLFSVFDTKDYPHWTEMRNQTIYSNLQHCIYRGNRYPPDHAEKYTINTTGFCVRSIQLLSFMILEHSLLFITAIMAYSIPDLPRTIRERLSNERIRNIKTAVSDYQKSMSNLVFKSFTNPQ